MQLLALLVYEHLEHTQVAESAQALRPKMYKATGADWWDHYVEDPRRMIK